MNGIPSPEKQRTTYENFEARCPSCQHWNVYNRASDLKAFAPVGGLRKLCLNPACGRPLWLTGDWINPPFEMLLFEAQCFWKQKHYIQCIVTSVLAIESFMVAVVNTRLLYRPFPNQPELPLFNELSKALYERTRRHAFARMRNLLLTVVVDGLAPTNLDEAHRIIISLPDRPSGVRRDRIVLGTTGTLQRNLLRLHGTKCHELRNLVVHRHAYRPTRLQAARVHVAARWIVYGLKNDLGRELEFLDYANAPPWK